MFTVSHGDWRKPSYGQESMESFYEKMRKPLGVGGVDGADPTTINLTDDLALAGTKSVEEIVQLMMRSEFTMVTGFLRLAWVWGLGYVLHERVADWRVSIVIGAAALDLTADYTSFEVLRQEMLDHQIIADTTDDSILRADARRALLDFYNVRTFRRISGDGNSPVARYEGDGLASITAGGGWGGCVYEIATLVFPGLKCRYTAHSMMEKTMAMTNAIASLPRDQREGTTNALIPIYEEVSGDLAADLMTICNYMAIADGDELSMVGHHVAITNNHSRYSMLAVFLAAARLGTVSLTTCGVHDTWIEKAIAFAKKMPVPISCMSAPQEDRELRIVDAINRIWIHIELAEKNGTDDSIESAQRALHRFVDEEVMGICWQRADPAVLWAVCAALFWAMLRVDGMAKLLLRGDIFKSLYVETEGFEDVWLREIYESKP